MCEWRRCLECAVTEVPHASASRRSQVGKWHVGYVTPEYAPWHRGFLSAHGFFASGVDYFTKCSYKSAPPTDTRPLAWCQCQVCEPESLRPPLAHCSRVCHL